MLYKNLKSSTNTTELSSQQKFKKGKILSTSTFFLNTLIKSKDNFKRQVKQFMREGVTRFHPHTDPEFVFLNEARVRGLLRYYFRNL